MKRSAVHWELMGASLVRYQSKQELKKLGGGSARLAA